MSQPVEVAVNNLSVLRTFVDGEKPVYNRETGEISKEDRYVFIGLRRWWTGAFNPNVLSSTFETTLPLIKVTEIKVYDSNDKAAVRKVAEFTEAIARDFLPALEGVKNIIQTYKNANNLKTAEKIQPIYDKFSAEYANANSLSGLLSPFPPPPPFFFDEKKKYTRTTIAAVNASAAARSKGVLTQYQQDLHAQVLSELQVSLSKQLKKVEIDETSKIKEVTPAIFNASMIDKLPQAPIMHLETDDKDWKVDKPTLLRTQSEMIQRPVVQNRDYSRPKFIPNQPQVDFDTNELKAKIAESLKLRRKKMGE